MPNVVKGQITEEIRSAYLTQHRRRQYPKSYFLLVTADGERKFPYKDPKTGAIHCGLLRAAITRAGQYGYKKVQDKARALYEKHCKVKKDMTVVGVEGKEVFGAVLVPGQKDADGDVFDAETIRKMCYDFNTQYGNAGYRHVTLLKDTEATLLESYCLPAEMTIGDQTYPEGTWMARMAIKDGKLRKEIKEGKIVGFSVGGVYEE